MAQRSGRCGCASRRSTRRVDRHALDTSLWRGYRRTACGGTEAGAHGQPGDHAHPLPSASALEHQALNEHLCLAAARLAGLTAAVTRVQNFGGTTAIVVQRYDRVARRSRTPSAPEDLSGAGHHASEEMQ